MRAAVTRKLSSDERALWAKVVGSVRPLHRQPQPAALGPSARRQPPAKPQLRPIIHHPPSPVARVAADSGLDSSWDRRLARGLAEPDLVVDLHGLSLAAAYARIDAQLDQALAGDARLILLITGKAPQAERAGRGRIRAAVEDWLAASRHSRAIAAVRPAHRRHGGDGALYIVLRRRAVRHRQKS
jgi:DNA-nicking Smr family endonuclease